MEGGVLEEHVKTDQQNGTPIRVLVVDDHDLFRAGLASLLSEQDGIEIVAQASGGRMGVRLAGELQPDVVLMDIRMDDLSGIEATRQVIEQHPDIRVLALTVVSTEDEVIAALHAGASGFLAKDTEIVNVVVAIRAAVAGTAWLSPQAAQVVLGRIRDATVQEPQDPRLLDQLSSREREVLRLIAIGKENSEIASELNISPRTAKNHVSSILTKLDVPSRVQAAVYAVRQGVT
jgi:two-component system, NarL family, response regulator LiaR